MIYLYAIAHEFNQSLDPPVGIENQGVYKINCGTFALIVSPTLTTNKEITLSKESIYGHEKVVEFYLQYTELLPVRFNTVFDNEAVLISTLKPYSLEIETNLVKVSNCIEMGIKVLVKNAQAKKSNVSDPENTFYNQTTEDIPKAKKYILDKFSAYKDAFYLQEKYKAQGKTIYNLLEECSRQSIKLPIAANSHLILNSVFLVQKKSLNDFKIKFQTIKQDFADFAFLLSGPWPTYSFVDFSIDKNPKAKKEVSFQTQCLS